MFRRFLLLFASCLLVQFLTSAQDFRPKNSWPFLYSDFSEGVVCNLAGEQILSARLNISVSDQRLYYIKDETIMVADQSRIFSVKIGNDIFINVGGKFYKVLAESEGGAAVMMVQVDIDRLSKASIGYGVSSATASTQNVAALSLESTAGTNINQAMHSRDSGEDLPVLEKKFILYNYGFVVPALKREVMSIPGLDKDAANAFFKQNKIKWNNPESLTQVADFLTGEFRK